MKAIFSATLFCLACSAAPAFAQNVDETAATSAVTAPTEAAATTPVKASETDSQQMSKDLQSLPWKPFKAIIEAVPKLASDVNAYGPLGWQFVRENYRTYDWKKKIDKLDAVQKTQLGELIRNAKH